MYSLWDALPGRIASSMTSEKSGREPASSDLVTGRKRDNALSCRHRTSIPYRKRYE